MKRIRLRKELNLFFTAFLVLGLLACSGDGGSVKTGETLAKVNGVKITQGEINILLETLPERARAYYQTPTAKKQLVDRMVTQELLFSEAQNRGIAKRPEVKAQVETAKRSVYAKYLIDEVTKERTSDEALRKKFDTDKDKYSKEEVRASHILVKDEDLANKVYRLVKKGGDFSKLAAKYSQDPSNKDKGGDLNWFPRERMVKPFSDVAFSMKKGEISEPVKTQFGWHIIRLDDRREGKDFDEIKDQIRAELTRSVRTEYIAELKKNAKIEVFIESAPASAPRGPRGMPGGNPHGGRPPNPHGGKPPNPHGKVPGK